MAPGKNTSTDNHDPDSTDDFSVPQQKGGLLDSKPTRFVLIYCLPALTCLLAGSAIYVSRLGIEQDIHVITEETWVSGQRSSARIVVYDSSGQPADQMQARLSLIKGENQEFELGQPIHTQGASAADFEFDVPQWPDGSYPLFVQVKTLSGSEDIRTSIKLVSEPPHKNRELYLPPRPEDRAIPRTKADFGDDLSVEILPYGSGVVPNLNNILFVRTTGKKQSPKSLDVRVQLLSEAREKLDKTITTDEFGLGVLSLYPISGDVIFDVSLPQQKALAKSPEDAEAEESQADAGPADSDAGVADSDAEGHDESPQIKIVNTKKRLIIPTTPAQIVMRIDSPAPEALEPLSIRVSSLPASRPLYVDSYVEGRWVGARTGQIFNKRGKVSLTRLDPGLAFLQSYISSHQIRYAYSAHHIYLRGADQSDTAALSDICKILEDRDIEADYIRGIREQDLLKNPRRFKLAAAFLLSRLDKGYFQPPFRVSSRMVRSAELEAFQDSFKTRISFGIGLIGLLIAGLLAYSFSVAAYRSMQQRKMLEADLGSDQDDLFVTSMGRPAGLDRFRTILQIVLMVGVVALGFILIAVLMSALTWGR